MDNLHLDQLLLDAAHHSRIDDFERLLSLGANPNAICEKDKLLSIKKSYSPLIIAAAHGNLAHCQLLVQAGADVHYQASEFYHMTAHIAAAAYGQLGCLQFLVEQGAAIDQATSDGETALGWCATDYWRLPALKEQVIKYLIGQGADVNQRDNQGRTPMMKLFSFNADKDYLHPLLPFMIEQGADVTITDHDGRTVFDYAKQYFASQAVTIIHATIERKVLSEQLLQQAGVDQTNNFIAF